MCSLPWAVRSIARKRRPSSGVLRALLTATALVGPPMLGALAAGSLGLAPIGYLLGVATGAALCVRLYRDDAAAPDSRPPPPRADRLEPSVGEGFDLRQQG